MEAAHYGYPQIPDDTVLQTGKPPLVAIKCNFVLAAFPGITAACIFYITFF